MKVKVFDKTGASKGDVEVSDDLFGQEINQGLLHETVTRYLANKRQGTAKTKNRADVAGGGVKPWKQKGTGRARSGSNTSPIWVRGGKAHGANPRSYYVEIPKKVRKTALRHALGARFQSDAVIVVEDFTVSQPKTKEVVTTLSALEKTNGKTLIVTENVDKNLYLSARNCPGVEVKSLSDINALDVINSSAVVFASKGAIDKVGEVVSK